MLRYAEDLALVLPDKLLKCSCIPVFSAFNQRYVGVDLFRCWGLDGGHSQKVRKTHTEIARLIRWRDSVFSLSVNAAGAESKEVTGRREMW